VNRGGQDILLTIVVDYLQKVKKIFFCYPSDYEHKRIDQAGKRNIALSYQPIAWIGRGPIAISPTSASLKAPTFSRAGG
jgi:hypothetical protein